jgi:2-polyprenyl-3-methyl-5-hydroxy-6-metoxy-1,4-benzoquinol methylase
MDTTKIALQDMTASLFETIACPLCGEAAFDIVKPSKYSSTLSVDDVRKAYSASSSHQLLDQVVTCRSCSLHYVNPRPQSDLIIESYSAAEDPTFVAQNKGRIRSFEKVLRKVLALEGRRDGEGQRFLDIGCAGGASLVAAKACGFDPVGVEPSRWMADFGRRSYGVDIHDGILQPGMFPERSFDFITLWDVLEHIPEPKALLELICRLLRPKGMFVVSYPDFRSVMGRILGDRWPFWLSVHLLYYDRTTIARQLTTCGFRIERYLPFFPSLELGYIVKRASPYVPGLKPLRSIVGALGLKHIHVVYNLGQTIVIAKKGDGS